jgi:hypothetical protein
MPTVADYDELIRLAQRAVRLQRKRDLIVEGKVIVRDPITHENFERSIDAGAIATLDGKIATAEADLANKFAAMFP